MGKISLEQLQNLQNFQCVSTNVKVDVKMEVKAGLFKQDVTKADSTGTARLTLWQDHIGSIEVDKSYLVENVLVVI